MRRPRKLLTVLIIAAILVALRFVVPIGLAWRHYESTPDFDTFVRAHPVDVSALGLEPDGAKVLAEDGAWSVRSDDGPVDEPTVEVSNTVSIRIDHGDDELLRFEQLLSFEACEDDGERLGFAVRTTDLRTDPRMRAIVHTNLSAADELVGDGTDGRGSAIVDVFLVSGAGDSIVRIVEEADLPEWHGVAIGFEWWRPVFGIAHPPVAAPDEGLVYHARQTVYFNWRILEGGSQSFGTGETEIAVNANQYSFDFEVESAETKPTLSSHSEQLSLTWTWNDRIW